MRREELLTTGPLGWLAVPKTDGDLDFAAPRVPNALRPMMVGLAIEVDGVKPEGGDKAPVGIAVVTSGVFCNNLGMQVNGDLALNICNWLAERRVLLDIRGSGYKATYLKLDEGQARRIQDLLVYGTPGLFCLLGLLMFLVRRRI